MTIQHQRVQASFEELLRHAQYYFEAASAGANRFYDNDLPLDQEPMSPRNLFLITVGRAFEISRWFDVGSNGTSKLKRLMKQARMM
jgi:hypothetical protein